MIVRSKTYCFRYGPLSQTWRINSSVSVFSPLYRPDNLPASIIVVDPGKLFIQVSDGINPSKIVDIP